MGQEPNTHGVRIDFGKHQGELLTRLPVSYLRWMVCNNTRLASLAEAELKRRGTVTPDLDISGHAVDRASLHCRKQWHETCKGAEGIHAWLSRMASEALSEGERLDSGKIEHKGIKFAFEEEGRWPVLKTVMPAKKKDDP